MQVVHHETPPLKMPEFVCDAPLHTKLNNNPLLRYMNQSFACMMVGKPQSGKTSLMTALLQTPSGARCKCKASYRKVFHKIYVFMPNTSQQSMKDNIFATITAGKVYENVTLESLNEVYEMLKSNSEQGLKSLLILDDQQSYLKGACENLFLHINSNRRHLKTSLFIVCQNYICCPRNVRKIITDCFLFNTGNEDAKAIRKELFQLDKGEFESLQRYYQRVRVEDPHAFLYVHLRLNKYFVNWDEIVFDDDG